MIIGSAIIFAVLLAAIAYMTIAVTGKIRGIVVTGTFLIILIVCWWGIAESLGRPKPFRLEFANLQNVTLLSAVPVEGVAIYVWLGIPGHSEPRAYTLPWSQDSAQQLQDAMTQADDSGTHVVMSLAKGGQNAGEPMFYAAPQPPGMEKSYDVRP